MKGTKVSEIGSLAAGRCRFAPLVAAAVLLTLSAAARSGFGACLGDCNGNGTVSAGELTKIITIINLCGGTAVGCAQVPGTDKECTNADKNGNGTISAGELTNIIANIINITGGCPAATPTTGAAASPTPTATPTTGPPLGVRVFSMADRPKSDFYTSVYPNMGSAAAANPGWLPGPMKLVAGPVGPDGVASVSVQEDALFGWKMVNNSIVCMKIFAAGSSGTIDCDGGSPHDATYVQDSNQTGPPDPPITTLGLGADGGPGAASLTASIQNINVNKVCSVSRGTRCDADKDCPGSQKCELPNPADCTVQTWNTPITTRAMTTRQLTVTMLDAVPGSPQQRGDGSIVAVKTGVNFSCADWKTENSPGTFMVPFMSFDSIVKDVINVLQMGD